MAFPGRLELAHTPPHVQLGVFSVDSHSDLPHDSRRPAKRRRLLESDAKEYPAGLIADDGRGAAALRRPQRNHIGPIDPDAFITLNQFLNSLTICATADVLVDDGEVWSRSLPTAVPNASAGPASR